MNTTNDVRDVVIIGSGPAGLTAALYASRAMLKPLVITGFRAGGSKFGQLMTTNEVENFPGYPDGVDGPSMMRDLHQQATRFGTEYLDFNDVLEADLSQRPFTLRTGFADTATGEIQSEGPTVRTKSLIVATGATAKYLGIPGEDTFHGAGPAGGVTACATCDGAFPRFRDREVIVVGGGDTAMEEAMFLTRYVKKVWLVHRRSELRASKVMQRRVLNHEKIEVVWNTVATEVKGNDQDGVTHVALKNLKTGEETDKPIAGFFLAIGHKPNTDLFKGVIDLDEVGYIKLADPPTTYTNVPGVFVCGDAADAVYRQAITAAGTGCAAAIDAERWLEAQGE